MNTKNYSTPTQRYRTLISGVHSIYRLVNSTFELKDLVVRLARLTCQIFNAHYCTLLLLEPNNDYSSIKCVISGKNRHIIDKRMKLTNRLEKRIVRTLSSVRCDGFIALPLVCEELTGVLILRRSGRYRPFDRFDQEMLVTITEQAIVGIRSLQAYEEHQKTVLGSIKSLVSLLDMRVPQGYTHSPLFSRLVAAIAQEFGLDEKQIESLKYASLLHDAGRIDIPLEILTKRSKLTADEYQIIKNHPMTGAQLLRPIQTLRPVIPIIMHHHEKYDGTGYPSRLKKGQIPVGARVMAVADAFEAMVYGRPYRERVAIEVAVREIRKKSGTQFDPKVVEAFLRVVKKMDIRKYLKPDKETRYNRVHEQHQRQSA